MTKKESDHARYMRHREERIARQRAYYQEHREEILARKRKSGADTVRISQTKIVCSRVRQPRKVIDARYYMKHREEILEKKRRNYERRKQQTSATEVA